jgi:hypothetical protein
MFDFRDKFQENERKVEIYGMLIKYLVKWKSNMQNDIIGSKLLNFLPHPMRFYPVISHVHSS